MHLGQARWEIYCIIIMYRCVEPSSDRKACVLLVVEH